MQGNSQIWVLLEGLIDPDPYRRGTALEELGSLESIEDQPLILYLLATRLEDPDLEIRFHAVKILGSLVESDPGAQGLPEKSFRTITSYTTQMDKSQLIKLLEVSVAYLAAEESIVNILRLCSYAGKALSGIVNDRRLPVEIRKQALYYCGEVGFLNSARPINNLIQRIKKNSAGPGLNSRRKKHLDEEELLPFAVAALGKLEGS